MARRGVVHTTLCDNDLRQVGGFSGYLSNNKTDRHDMAEILLKVALNTLTLTLTVNKKYLER